MAKEKLVSSGAPIRKESALMSRLKANHTGFGTAASLTEEVRYIDVWNPLADIPSIAMEYLVGAKGWLAGRICQERATFGKSKSSFMYLQYAAAQKRTGAYCLHIETEGAPSPADWVASFGCDPETLHMIPQNSLDSCLEFIDEYICEIRGGFGGMTGDSGRSRKTEFTNPDDPDMKYPIMIGVDSLSQLDQEEKVDKDIADMSKTAQPGYVAKKMREWFALRTQRMYDKQACLFLTTHETTKIQTGPMAGFGGPQKTSKAADAIAINATYAYDIRNSIWKANRTGEAIGKENVFSCFKNKWSGDYFNGAKREVALHLKIGHGFDLIHSDTEFLMKHASSPFSEKMGLFERSQVPQRTSAGIKCTLLSDKTFRSEEDFIRALYGNEDLLMALREALRLRGFGFKFESGWKQQEMDGAAAEAEKAEVQA